MADLRTEEEQIEAIKRWWKENGRVTLLAVLLVVAAVGGWKSWQHFKQVNAEQASVLYQNLMAQVAVKPGQKLSNEDRQSAHHLAGQLKKDFSSSIYSSYAALWLARDAVEQKDLATAQTELNWVLKQEPEKSLRQITEMRLARVLLADGKADQAMSYVHDNAPKGYESSMLELKGDILTEQGKTQQAHQAYQAAMDAAGSAQRPVLEMKRDDFAVEG